jgi:hypothetical protein|eukprot:COSAG06_NODE_2545_length_6700_cov_12.854416_8_plen_163_part_00
MPPRDSKLVDLWGLTDVRDFFVDEVKDRFPEVYRVVLKFLPRSVACCFQERVFSTGKNVMPLNATRIGHRLFEAMVSLRHNRKKVQEYTSSQQMEITAHVDEEDVDHADLLEAVSNVVGKITKVSAFTPSEHRLVRKQVVKRRSSQPSSGKKRPSPERNDER